MKKILLVYNCCGIARDNIQMWSSHLNSILNQDYPNLSICISGCRISESSKRYFEDLQKTSIRKIYLSFIEDILPVNITFNKSCIEASKYENFDGFVYVASDVDMIDKTNVITKLVDLHFSKNCAITSCPVSFDSGIEAWLGHHIFNDYLNHNHFEIPVGKTCNLHCMLFDKLIYDTYDKKIIPDIFRTYCTESVFSFITSSLSKKFIIHNKSIMIVHLAGRDGSSIGFQGGRNWKDLFMTKNDVYNRLMTEEARSVGFGYEEYINVFLHDTNKYNSDNTHKNPQELLEFNKKSIYLSQEEFDYNKININFKTI